VSERLQFIPFDLVNELLSSTDQRDFYMLDVGCNAGDVTHALSDGFQTTLGTRCQIHALGVDIDKSLVERAVSSSSAAPASSSVASSSSSSSSSSSAAAAPSAPAPAPASNSKAIVEFGCLDIGDEKESNALLSDFFATPDQQHKFDLTLCLSVTMWIHLHNGDDGLCAFLRRLSSLSRFIVIEPQVWRSYKTCRTRWNRVGQQLPSHWDTIEHRHGVEQFIIDFLIDECKCTLVRVLGKTKWNRQVVLLKGPQEN
jgi:RNA 5'-monophosphate methyltransferase